MTIYAQDARLYDLIYGGDDADALAFVRWVLPYLQISKSDPVLDMGAGTGNLLLPLVEDGYAISGMEPFEKMRQYALTKAELAGTAISVTEGSFQTLDVQDQYQLIMAINGPLHYVKPEELDMVMKNLARALIDDGYVLFDTINFLSLIKNYKYPEPLEFELDDTPATAMVQHHVDLESETWTNRVILFYQDQEYQKFEDIQEMSMYTKSHLVEVAGRHGLRLSHFFSSYDDRPEERKYGGRLITIFRKSSD